jgi:hypothetical protein
VSPQDQKFEIPQELRELAEEKVERARQLYLQFMVGVEQAMARRDGLRSRRPNRARAEL